MGKYIDFRFVLAQASVEAVLAQLGVEPTSRSGDEIRARCPLPGHEDKKPSFSINATTGKWKCHACGADGDLLELVAEVKGIEKRPAAELIAEWSGSDVAPSRFKAERRGKGRGRRSALKTEADTSPAPAEEDDKPWEPFRTKLKLDHEHYYAGEMMYDPALCELFEMGYAERGMMSGRWAIPIHDENGDQVAYAGRWVSEEPLGDRPKWLLPKHFPKQDFLFNLHRVTDVAATDDLPRELVVVEGIGDAIRLHQLGIPVVSVIGTAVSERHIELLDELLDVDQFLVLFDGDEPGRNASVSAAGMLSQLAFTRIGKLPTDVDPQSASDDELEEVLWWL